MSLLWSKGTPPAAPNVSTRAEVLESRILAATARVDAALSRTTDTRMRDELLDLRLILSGGPG